MGTRRTISKGVVRTKMDSLVPQNGPEMPVQGSLDKILLAKFPAFDPNWTDEVKIKWFDAFDTLEMTLPVMTGLVQSLRLQPEHMAQQLEPGLLATEMADYLVKRGVPFRTAHGLVGQAVRFAEEHGQQLTDLSLADLQSISEYFATDVVDALQISAALAQRVAKGGTAPDALLNQLSEARAYLAAQTNGGDSSSS